MTVLLFLIIGLQIATLIVWLVSFNLARQRRMSANRAMEILELVKWYFDEARHARNTAVNELVPAVRAAAVNTQETKVAISDILPVAEEVKAAVLDEIKPTIEGLDGYAHKANHDQLGYWQTLFLKLDVLGHQLGVQLPPTKVREPGGRP